MMKALRGSMAWGSCSSGGAVYSDSMRPLWSVILAISQGLTRWPPLANTA
jgi:hypothetical protein